MARSVLLLVALLSLTAFDQIRLIKTKLADGITVFVPSGWRPMDGLDFNERYFSVRKPLGAFTDPDRLLSFTVSTSATQWPDSDGKLAGQFFKASLSEMFDRVQIIDEGIHEAHGKSFIYFEFEARVNGSRQDESLRNPVLQYSYVQYLVEPGRTLVFSFHCPARMRTEWQPVAQQMMKSVRIK